MKQTLHEFKGVCNPHVTTDRSVDCSSIDSIIKSIIKKDMTDEEKVLALFNWVRLVIYHGDGRIDDLAYNFHYIVNCTGHGSCLRQTTVLAVLLNRIGYHTRGWVKNGHHMLEVYYQGDWHCMDPHMNFYVYDRSNPPKIASVEQLRKEPDLALNAVREGRAGKGFLLCGDSPEVFAGDEGWVFDGEYPDGFAKPIINEPFGEITLRRGETYILTWWPDGLWHRENCWMKDCGPYHTCLDKDRLDEVNWPLYEPHGYKINGGIAYRRWGNGTLTYKPDLSDNSINDAIVSRKYLVQCNKEGYLAAEPGHKAEMVMNVDCPYVVTEGELTVSTSGEGEVAAEISLDKGETWIQAYFVKKGPSLKAVFTDHVNGSLNGYLIKITLEGDIKITEMELTTHFELNPYSLPYLAPGKNIVSIHADRYGSPLSVTYKWFEGEDWKETKSATGVFEQDGTMEIVVQGEKYPRIHSITLKPV